MPTLSVRPIRIGDLRRLSRLEPLRVPLSHCEAIERGALAEAMAALPLPRRSRRAFVAALDEQAYAVVAVRSRPRDYRWVVSELLVAPRALATETDLCVELWAEVLRYAVRMAGTAGAKRVHAAPPVDSPASAALHKAGFATYANHTVLLAHGLHPAGPEEIAVREQEPSDVWSVHQLYHVATPRSVQYAEAFTSNHWDIDRHRARRARAFLVFHEHEVAAYCQITSRGREHALDVLAREGEGETLARLVQAVAARSGIGSSDRVWLAVPDYHQDWIRSLEAVGFHEVERRARMVRYTAAPERGRLERSVAALPELAERLAGRAPSYSAANHSIDAGHAPSATVGMSGHGVWNS